jgi:hypothetical protein
LTATFSLLLITIQYFRCDSLLISGEGHTYEREAVTAWLSRHGTSPITREYISSERLLSDPTLKKMIEDFVKEKQKQMLEKQLLAEAAAGGKDKERIRNSSSEEEEIDEIRAMGIDVGLGAGVGGVGIGGVGVGGKVKHAKLAKTREERVPLMLSDARDENRKIRHLADQKKKRLQGNWETEKRKKRPHGGSGGSGRRGDRRMSEGEPKVDPKLRPVCWSCTLY